MGKIRRKLLGYEEKRAAERVLSSCTQEAGLYCWTSAEGAFEIALFLQRHNGPEETLPDDEAQIRIAYRSWSRETIKFTWELECDGGTLAPYDSQKLLKIHPGRTAAQTHRSAVIPGGVKVTRDPGGAMIEAVLTFAPGGPKVSDTGTAEFSFQFPEGEALPCLCC